MSARVKTKAALKRRPALKSIPPDRIHVVIDGDNGNPLEYLLSETAAKQALRDFNRLEGYAPNCTLETHERVSRKTTKGKRHD